MTIEPSSSAKPPKKMPRGAIHLQFAGDIVLARCALPELTGLFRRYEALFEFFANTQRSDRILAYKLFNGLMLTSYAKKTSCEEEKKRLFELKNNIFISLANDPSARKNLSLKYLVSKNFRVTEFCPDCTRSNEGIATIRHAWKHCKKCQIDRDFFNVIAMSHKFNDGYVRLFLSNDQLHKIPFQKVKAQLGSLADLKEEAVCSHYQYNVRNLDAIAYDSVLSMYERFANK